MRETTSLDKSVYRHKDFVAIFWVTFYFDIFQPYRKFARLKQGTAVYPSPIFTDYNFPHCFIILPTKLSIHKLFLPPNHFGIGCRRDTPYALNNSVYLF